MPTCTEKEWALLNSMLAGEHDPAKVAEVIAERITPEAKERCVEAWAELIRAGIRREAAWDALGINSIGRAMTPIWDDLERQARERASK